MPPNRPTIRISPRNKTLRSNFEKVRKRIKDACARADRRLQDVTLIAVSKTHSVDAIRTLYDAGQRAFGESYVQEWQQKTERIRDPKYSDIDWHFIGHLQSNKAKYIADEVSMVHSVDRRSVLKRLQKRSHEPVDVLLQVNVAGQASKGGVAPDEVIELLMTAREYQNIRVRGLMCIPPYVDDPENNRVHFRQMRQIFERALDWLRDQDDDEFAAASACFRCLSMGMSGDFEVAIEEGATHVRVGTAIFGARQYENEDDKDLINAE